MIVPASKAGGAGGSTQDFYLAVGIVEDAFPHTGCYLVRMPGGGPTVVASDMFHGSGVPVGARPISGYPPRSRVLIYFGRSIEEAIILGGISKPVSNGELLKPEFLAKASKVGILEDSAHFGPMADPKSGLRSFSGGRPLDALLGDWGYVNDMGVGMFIGRLVAALRASDGAKVEAFWGDDLVRITGLNYELNTAGSADIKVLDEGEYDEIKRMTPYPWEALGVGTKGVNPFKLTDFKMQPGQLKEDFTHEPQERDQLIIPRLTTLKGYLGDLMRQWVSAPPPGLERETFSRKGDPYIGLSEVVHSSDGTLLLRSAKAVILEKYSIIPVPKQMISAEDPLGDSVKNGWQPAGAASHVPDFKWGSKNIPAARATQLFDYLAYVYGKYTTDGLRKHTKDWDYPEESDVADIMGLPGTIYRSGYAQLKTQFSLDTPVAVPLHVDPRSSRETVDFYGTRSGLYQLDDGSVILEDGYGSQILMTGGNIHISCPGDVLMRPGRSFIALAPFDAILRAGNSADISASKHDVRIKAERNLQLLGGNDSAGGNVGGILLECRAKGKPTIEDWNEDGERTNMRGIILKAPDSAVYGFGQFIHFGLTRPGVLSLDANGGVLFTRGNIQEHNFSQAVLFQAGGGTVFGFSGSLATLSTPLEVSGRLLVVQGSGNGDIIATGSVEIHKSLLVGQGVVTNGGFAALNGAPFVGKLDKPIEIKPKAEELTKNLNAHATTIRKAINQTDTNLSNNEDSPANPGLQQVIGFSMRDTVKDMKLDSATFLLPMARWQQYLDSGADQGGETWNESTVSSPLGTPGLPWPGYQGWTVFQALGKTAMVNFNMGAGHANAREGMKEQGSTLERTTLQSGYKVVSTGQSGGTSA